MRQTLPLQVSMSMLLMTSQGLGIDVGAVALFAFLVRRDLAARDKQMARMLREEKLGALQLELANRKARFVHGRLPPSPAGVLPSAWSMCRVSGRKLVWKWFSHWT